MSVRTSLLAALLLALLPAGCSVACARVGVGVGLGAEVKLLGLHGGAFLGNFDELGPNYDGPWSSTVKTANLTVLHGDWDEGDDWTHDHTCFAFGLTNYLPFVGSERDPFAHSLALELAVAVLFVDLRAGVNPFLLLADDVPQQDTVAPPAEDD